jgi:hypothetical protein
MDRSWDASPKNIGNLLIGITWMFHEKFQPGSGAALEE